MKKALLFILIVLVTKAAITINGPVTLTGLFQFKSGVLGVPSKATNFSPADAATRNAINPTATWSAANGATGYDVYGDTFTPPTTLRASNQAGTSYAFTADYNTSFYWIISPKNSFGTTTGDTLSFSTLPAYNADFYTGYQTTSSAGTTLTSSILDEDSHSSTTAWTWTLSSIAAAGGGTVSAANTPPYSPLLVSSVPYTDTSGTRSIAFDVSNITAGSTPNRVRVLAPAAKQTTHWTVRCNITIPTNLYGAGYQTMDLLVIEANNGADLVLQTNASGTVLQTHTVLTGGGPLVSTEKYTYAAGTTYIVVMDVTNLGTGVTYLYSVTGTLLQTFNLDFSGTVSGLFRAVQIGRCDTHGNPQPVVGYAVYDGFAVNCSGTTIGP